MQWTIAHYVCGVGFAVNMDGRIVNEILDMCPHQDEEYGVQKIDVYVKSNPRGQGKVPLLFTLLNCVCLS